MFGQKEPEEAVRPHRKSVPLCAKTKELCQCLILPPHVRTPVNKIPAENVLGGQWKEFVVVVVTVSKLFYFS